MADHREPVVLIPGSPLDRVDPEVGQRVRAAIKRVRTGPQPVAGSKRTPPDASEATSGRRSSEPAL